MSCMPHVEAAPVISGSAAWPDLAAELDRWRAAGRVAKLWWRDDDAITPTPALDRLLALANGIPIGLAVIPARAHPSLADRLARAPYASVLQHGWDHRNHAGEGKKSEYPGSRSFGEVAEELAAGRTRLVELFGDRAAPIFVPPWNRFAEAFLPLLPGAGMAGLSEIARGGVVFAAPGLSRLDTHVDLIGWRAGGRFVGNAAAIDGITGQLRARRLASGDAASPTGILTHHLVTDRDGFAFLAELAAVTRAHPAARWVDSVEALGR